MRTTTVLNLDEALARVGGDSELLKEVSELFLMDYPNQVAGIRRAIERQDAAALHKSAHTLKGSIATFGAQAAVDAALRLEKAGKAQDFRETSQMFADLNGMLAALEQELRQL